MATALKNIQFNKPVMMGETNDQSGTSYHLNYGDKVIGGCSNTTIIEYDSQTDVWKFFGCAEFANFANSIIGESGEPLSYFDIANKLDSIYYSGSNEYYFIGGLTDGGDASLGFYEIYGKLNVIYGDTSGGDYYFSGGLIGGCGNSLTFDYIYDRLVLLGEASGNYFFNGGLTINGTNYVLSVDSNGFVKAT